MKCGCLQVGSVKLSVAIFVSCFLFAHKHTQLFQCLPFFYLNLVLKLSYNFTLFLHLIIIFYSYFIFFFLCYFTERFWKGFLKLRHGEKWEKCLFCPGVDLKPVLISGFCRAKTAQIHLTGHHMTVCSRGFYLNQLFQG